MVSLRNAINEFCKSCIYDPHIGTGEGWRQQIEACTSTSCPLFEVRPKQHPGDKKRSAKVRDASSIK